MKKHVEAVFTEEGKTYPVTYDQFDDGANRVTLHSKRLLDGLQRAALSLILPSNSEGEDCFGPLEREVRGPRASYTTHDGRYPEYSHLIEGEYGTIIGYNFGLNQNTGGPGMVYAEEHGQPDKNEETGFAVCMDLQPYRPVTTEGRGEEIGLLHYETNDPNVEIIPNSPHRIHLPQPVAEFAIYQTLGLLANLSDSHRRSPTPHSKNPFADHTLRTIYDHTFGTQQQ